MADLNRGQQDEQPAEPIPLASAVPVAGESQEEADARAAAQAEHQAWLEREEERVARGTPTATTGYETPTQEQIDKAAGNVKQPAPVPITPAVQQYAIEHNISEQTAAETLARFQAYPKSSEFASWSEKDRQVVASILAGESTPYEVAPETIATGTEIPTESGKTRLASTPEAQRTKAENYQAGVSILQSKGLLDEQGNISPEVYYRSRDDAEVRQALYDVGISGAEVSGGIAQAKAYETYQQEIDAFIDSQVARGLATDKAQAERQLADIQSGEYVAWMPDADDPEDESKGQFVPVWREYVVEREAAGLSPKELGEVYSGKYVVNGIPVTQASFITYEGQQKALSRLQPYAAESGGYYIDKFLHDSRLAKYGGEDVLRSAGYTEEQINKAKIEAGKQDIDTIRPGGSNIFARTGGALELGLQEFVSRGADTTAKTKAGSILDTAMGGIGATGATLLLSIPTLALKGAGSPAKIPGLAWEASKGIVTLVGGTLYNYATGKYISQVKEGNAFPIVYDTLMTYLIVEGAAKGVKGVVSKVTTYVAPRGITPGSIGAEPSTGRITISAEELTSNYAKAANKAEKLAATKGGKFTENIPIEGTDLQLRVLKTPLEQITGNVLFHGTKDVVTPTGQIIKSSLLKVAEEQGKVSTQSYVTLDQFGKIKQLADQIPGDVAKIDVSPIRKLNFADATDVPKNLVSGVAKYIQDNNGRVYGSFVEWLKLKDATRPHDIDVVFKSDKLANTARASLLDMAKKAGYEARANDRGVQIKTGDTWTTFVNVVSEAQHRSMIKGIFKPSESLIDGVRVETLGSQAVMQRLGSLAGDAKASIRAARLKNIAKKVVKIANDTKLSGKLKTELNQIVVGDAGLYTSPWSPIAYTRGGSNPGLMMIVTDATKLQSGEVGLARGMTQSDRFIRGADKGFYGSSKTWRGDLETEVVGAPGTKITVPEPSADLTTRVIAGKYADFFTYDSGRYIPIKIGLDAKSFSPETLAALKQPSTMYAIKLYSLYGALRNTAEAMKHPGLMLKDIAGTFKELVNLERYGQGTKGSTGFPGVRDVYVTTNWGKNISEIARNTWEQAFKKTREQLGDSVKSDSATFKRALERNMDAVYRANADALIQTFSTVAQAYGSSQAVRGKFEASYMANLALSTEAIAKSASLSSSILQSAVSDVISTIPNTSATSEAYDSLVKSIVSEMPETSISSMATSGTPVTSEIPRTGETLETPRTPETGIISTRTPETPRTTETRIPRTPRTPDTPVSSIPRYPRKPRVPNEPPTSIIVNRLQTNSPMSQPVPEGSIAWAQGMRRGSRGMLVPQWYYIPPPWDVDKPISMSAPPLGAVRSDSAIPSETIQVIGRSRTASVPAEISVDMGATDVFITDSGRRIAFKGKGMQTDVGTSISSPAIGLDINLTPGAPIEGLSRVNVSKRKPRRKGKRGVSSEALSIRGIRY